MNYKPLAIDFGKGECEGAEFSMTLFEMLYPERRRKK